MSLLAPGTYDIPSGSTIDQPSGDHLTLVEGGLLTVPVPPDPGVTTTIDSSYEGGNGANPIFSGRATVALDAVPDPGGFSTLFDFELLGDLGSIAASATISFPGLFSGTGIEKTLPWYSLDAGATWQRATLAAFDLTASPKTITVTTPVLPAGTLRCRIAETPPYTMALYESDMARWLATPWCQAAQIGTSVEGRIIYRFTVTDASVADSTKKRAYFTGEWHPQERYASRRLRAMLDYLTNGDANAAAIRRRRIVHVVVRPNPDGVVHGWMRSNAQGKQMNRWNPGAPDLAIEGPEQFAVHSDVAAFMSATPPLRLFLDNHTAWDGGDYCAVDPTCADLTTMNLHQFDANNYLMTPPFTSTVATLEFSHRALRVQFPSPIPLSAAYIDGGGQRHAKTSVLVSVATKEAEGAALARSVDAWLATH